MSRLKNERGNASFYVIWLTFILGLMLILVINIADVFLVNQQASIGVEQASLAATNYAYDCVYEDAVEKYDDFLNVKHMEENEGEPLPGHLRLKYKIDQKMNEYISGGYTVNEAKMKAIDSNIASHLLSYDGELGKIIDDLLDDVIFRGKLKDLVESIINENNGDPSKAKIRLFKKENFGSSYHIEVTSSIEFKGTKFQSFISDITMDMEQSGIGPKIGFAKEINYLSDPY